MRFLSRSSKRTFRNWAGTVQVEPREFLQLQSEGEVVAAVRAARRRGGQIRVVGAGHSWTDVAACDDVLVSLDGMQTIHEVDYERLRVTVDAGIRLHRLVEELDARGLALLNLGSVVEQSLAGAISTGTHGSGLAYGALPTQMTAFRLVTGTGEVLDVDAEGAPELFAAAAVSFGCLGIITRITLQVERSYDIEEHCFSLPFDELLETAEHLYTDHPRVKFWWLPHTGRVQVYTYDKTTSPRRGRSELQRRMDQFVNDRLFNMILGVGSRIPAAVPRLNRLVGASYFRPYRRIDRGDRLLTVSMPPVHLENEYGIPVEKTAEMMDHVRRLIERERLSVGFVNEVRFVRADQNWLSGAYGRDSCQFGAYTPDGRHARRFLEGVEDIAYELGGRPHWGKDHHADPAYLRTVFPRFDDFVALRAQMDPDGIFVNDFARRTFGLR